MLARRALNTSSVFLPSAKLLLQSYGLTHPEYHVPQEDQTPDDVSTPSLRKEQGKEARSTNDAGSKGVPTLGTLVRGPVGSEGEPNDDAFSPGSQADRAAAREREEHR